MAMSLIGRLFYFIDFKICKNIKIFLKNHYYSIEAIFLLSHVSLQILLILFVNLLRDFINIVIGIFVALFLFVISLERLILKFKTKDSQQKTENLEGLYCELKKENEELREDLKQNLDSIKDLIEKIKG